MAFNSTVEQEACVKTMTDKQLTMRLYEHLKAANPCIHLSQAPHTG